MCVSMNSTLRRAWSLVRHTTLIALRFPSFHATHMREHARCVLACAWVCSGLNVITQTTVPTNRTLIRQHQWTRRHAAPNRECTLVKVAAVQQIWCVWNVECGGPTYTINTLQWHMCCITHIPICQLYSGVGDQYNWTELLLYVCWILSRSG